MPKVPGKPISFFNNTKGMMPYYSGVLIPHEGARYILNTNLTPIGGFSVRNGYTRLNAAAQSAAICTGLYDASYSSGTHYLVGTCGTKIGLMTSMNGTWTDKTGSLTITAGQNNQFSFAMLNDIVVCCNGTDTCIQIDASQAAAVLAGSPAFTSALFAVVYRGYMFYGNVVEGGTAYPDRLRFSNQNTPNVFNSINFIDVHTKDGETLRGAIVFGGDLLCFKESGFYQVQFQPTRVDSSGNLFPFIQTPNPIEVGVGTQSPRTLLTFTTPISHERPGRYVFFLDQFGSPRVYPGNFQWGFGYQSMRIGTPISSSRDSSLTSFASLDKNVSVLRSCFAVDYPERNQIWLFMKTTVQMDTVWILDYTTTWAWSRHNFSDAFTCGARVQHTDGTYKIYTGDRNGFTDIQDKGSDDNGTAIVQSYETGEICDEESSSIRSNWPQLEARGTSATVLSACQIGFIPDGDDVESVSSPPIMFTKPQALWGQVVWGQFNWAKTGVVSKTLNPALSSKTLRIKWQNVAGSIYTVEGFTVFQRPEGTVFE